MANLFSTVPLFFIVGCCIIVIIILIGNLDSGRCPWLVLMTRAERRLRLDEDETRRRAFIEWSSQLFSTIVCTTVHMHSNIRNSCTTVPAANHKASPCMLQGVRRRCKLRALLFGWLGRQLWSGHRGPVDRRRFLQYCEITLVLIVSPVDFDFASFEARRSGSKEWGSSVPVTCISTSISTI